MNDKNPIRLGISCSGFLKNVFLLVTACGTAHSQIQYSSDFESLDVNNSSALRDTSWTAYANVFSSGGAYLYGYSSTPPIGGGGFWGVTTDQAGPAQGTQGLVVYSDYYNQNAQTAGNLVEANVFQQFPVFIEDVGTYEFKFDAKAGNLVSPSKAVAFVKVLNPSNNYATVANVTFDTSALPVTWGTYSIRFTIDAGMEDMILQVGFSATTSNNLGSGVFYDNLEFGIAPPAPPVITQIAKVGNVVNVTFPTELGASYDLFKSTDGMATFNLVATQPVISGDGTAKVATDNAASGPSAFYRIRRQQQATTGN